MSDERTIRGSVTTLADGTRLLVWSDAVDAIQAAAEARALAMLPDGVLAFVNWFAEGLCACDGGPDDLCDSCRALALLAVLDGTAAARPDPPGEFDNPYDGKDRAVYAEGFGRGYHAGRITAAALPDPPTERCASCGGPNGHLGACTTWTPPKDSHAHAVECADTRGYARGRFDREAAALPDERLREALARANDDLILIADEAPEDIGESIDSVRAAIKDALAAADREKPDEDQT